LSDAPLVSVVIPTLNRSQLTLDAVNSVHAQSYPSLEVLVVDNGSDSAHLQVLRKTGLALMQCGTPGAGAARKLGLGHASGELILFLDSDDLLHVDAIQQLVREVGKSGDGSYGLIRNENNSSRTISNPERPHRWPMASNTLLRRAVFDSFGSLADDNYSFPRWVTHAMDSGLNLSFTGTIVATRRVFGDNVSLESEPMAFFFDLIRERLGRPS
jgi:glycosyltransferase involved in cell wall biosynthesis